jgi:hypothetical protein
LILVKWEWSGPLGSRPCREESSFSEEKEAKRLLSIGRRVLGCPTPHCEIEKVFWFFFSKKNPFFPYANSVVEQNPLRRTLQILVLPGP